MSSVEDLFSRAVSLIEADSPQHEQILPILNESKIRFHLDWLQDQISINGERGRPKCDFVAQDGTKRLKPSC